MQPGTSVTDLTGNMGNTFPWALGSGRFCKAIILGSFVATKVGNPRVVELGNVGLGLDGWRRCHAGDDEAGTY